MRAILLLAIAVPSLAFGWGFDGHRKLASMMQDALPADLCLRAWLLVAFGCLALAGCRDRGVEKYDQALHQYEALVGQGVRATDPRFAEVEKLLDAVPADSTARVRADTLRRALQSAQAPKLRTPLAIQGGAHLPSEVAAQLAHCRKLAEEFGTTPEAERAAKLGALDACRAAAEQLDEASHALDAGR